MTQEYNFVAYIVIYSTLEQECLIHRAKNHITHLHGSLAKCVHFQLCVCQINTSILYAGCGFRRVLQTCGQLSS